MERKWNTVKREISYCKNSYYYICIRNCCKCNRNTDRCTRIERPSQYLSWRGIIGYRFYTTHEIKRKMGWKGRMDRKSRCPLVNNSRWTLGDSWSKRRIERYNRRMQVKTLAEDDDNSRASAIQGD